MQLNPSSWATINNVALYQQPLADSRIWGGRWPHDNRCGWGDNQRDGKSCDRWSVISNILRGPFEGDQSVKLCRFYEMPHAAPTVHLGSICVMTAKAKKSVGLSHIWISLESACHCGVISPERDPWLHNDVMRLVQRVKRHKWIFLIQRFMLNSTSLTVVCGLICLSALRQLKCFNTLHQTAHAVILHKYWILMKHTS